MLDGGDMNPPGFPQMEGVNIIHFAPDGQRMKNNTAAPPLDFKVYDAGDDTEKPPPRGWLLGNQFCRRFLSGLMAPGATGKTALRYAQYISLAIGRSLTGHHVFQRGRVLVLGLEDDIDEMRRRIEAVALHFGITREELKGWLFYAAPRGLKLAEMRHGSPVAGALDEMLRRKAAELKIDLLGVDPFVKAHGMNENDNAGMDYVADMLARLAIEFDMAVDIPMHTRKGMSSPGDSDSGRGASAVRDAGRLVFTLSRMSEEEAKDFKVKETARRLYVRLDNGKVNLSPGNEPESWFKLVGVKLNNGNDQYPAGDDIQTVEPWKPPATWEGTSTDTINAILDDIDFGMVDEETGRPTGHRYSENNAAKKRSVWPVLHNHLPAKTDKQIKEIVRIWLQNGVLEYRNYENPDRKETLKGLYVITAKRPGKEEFRIEL